MCCYDYEPALVLDSQKRTARITHKCGECGGLIRPGETYEDVRGLWADSDRWERYRTCAACLDARQWMIGLDEECACWQYLGLQEDLENVATEAWRIPGARFGAWRRILMMRRRGREAHRERAA